MLGGSGVIHKSKMNSLWWGAWVLAWSKARGVQYLSSLSPGFWWFGGSSALHNIGSNWWLVAPLLFYFSFLGLGAHSSSLSPENTAFLSSWEQYLFPGTFNPGYIRGKKDLFPCLWYYLSHPHTGGQHRLVVGCIRTSAPVAQTLWPFISFPSEMHGLGVFRIHFVQIRSKACFENHW